VSSCEASRRGGYQYRKLVRQQPRRAHTSTSGTGEYDYDTRIREAPADTSWIQMEPLYQPGPLGRFVERLFYGDR
jgi:hypothetical protein